MQDSALQQKACDVQAEKYARYELQEHGKVPLKSGYVNHYEAKANRCYVETAIDFGDSKDEASLGQAVHPPSGKVYTIRDAFVDGDGSPTYGEFSQGSWCKINPQGERLDSYLQRYITCRSEAEFNDLALKYFGIAQPPKPTTPANNPKW